jgi:hypothetical protein
MKRRLINPPCRGGASRAVIVELTTFHIDPRGDIKSFGQAEGGAPPPTAIPWAAVGVT